MKEFTIEEKAQRYDEAIKIAKDSFNYPDYPGFIRADVVFPELKESEDERMVKFIKQQLFKIKETITVNYELDAKLTKAIDWLEKQYEKGTNGNEREIPFSEQEWSEEDEKMFNRCVNTMKGAYYLDGEALYWLENRFKSPRPHNNITDEELAQAKKDAYRDALDKIEYHSGDPTFDDGWSAAIWYLKKRNTMPQSCWKPSELQIEALESATANCAYSEYEDCLRELITQLKKLREE